jgi:hypothetical protein
MKIGYRKKMKALLKASLFCLASNILPVLVVISELAKLILKNEKRKFVKIKI